MQLHALDQKNQLTFAKRALKHTDYFCLECQGIVRLRGGIHRQDHFYHLQSNQSCRLNAKSMIHIQLQYYFFNRLPREDCLLEHRFPEINRIADVYWVSEKLIFEIQCSPISKDEVEQRNKDYRSLGLNVVWVLHDMRFNQWRISAAEMFLGRHPHYYTNMDAVGNGIVYDQYQLIHQGIRHIKMEPLPVDLICRKEITKTDFNKMQIPELILGRMRHWPFCFKGDMIELYLQNEELSYLNEAFQHEKNFGDEKQNSVSLIRRLFWKFILRPYFLFFQILLEKCCR
jgi:competence protein CoiA